MKTLNKIILFFCFLSINCFCQDYKVPNKSINNKAITTFGQGFSDYLFLNDRIYAVSKDNQLYSWKVSGDSVSNDSHKWPAKISILTKDKENKLIIGLESGQVFKLINSKWILTSDIKIKPLSLLFTSDNSMYAITKRGVISHTGTAFFPKKYNNHQLPFDTVNKEWFEPSCFLMDSKNNIWLGFARGEWGGDIQIFNTYKSTYEQIDWKELHLTLSPIISIFENDKKDVLITSGMRHMGTSGFLALINNFKTIEIFKISTSKVNSQYIGVGSFNQFEKLVYFYDDNGWSKQVSSETNLNFKFYMKRPIIPQDFSSSSKDYDIKIYSYHFVDKNKIVFNSNFGLGYLDGLKLTLFK